MVIKQLSEITKEYYKNGLIDENFVMNAVTNTLGGETTKASKYDDLKNHIDFWWNSPRMGLLGIDVKGLNKSKRNDRSYDDTIHWLELQNVNGGDGWLKGKADYIAFKTMTKILFVKRDKLLDFAEKKIEGKDIVYDTPKECYVPYQRKKWGREDIALKALNSDLEKLAQFCIDYN